MTLDEHDLKFRTLLSKLGFGQCRLPSMLDVRSIRARTKTINFPSRALYQLLSQNIHPPSG